MSFKDIMNFLEDHPNKEIALKAIQKLLGLKTKINQCVIVVALENETVGSIIVKRPNVGELSEQTKINAVQNIFSTFKLPYESVVLKDRA